VGNAQALAAAFPVQGETVYVFIPISPDFSGFPRFAWQYAGLAVRACLFNIVLSMSQWEILIETGPIVLAETVYIPLNFFTLTGIAGY
jgi:hypothetical protein